MLCEQFPEVEEAASGGDEWVLISRIAVFTNQGDLVSLGPLFLVRCCFWSKCGENLPKSSYMAIPY